MIIPADKLNFEKHICTATSSDMKDILVPLKRLGNIHHFCYEKLYKNHQYSFLTTDPAPSEIYHKQKLYNIAFNGDINNYKNHYYLLDSLPKNEISQLFQAFNISHELIIVKKYDEFCEFFFFGTTNDNYSINNFYLNNIDLFENFILSFKEIGEKNIQLAEREKIQYPIHHNDMLLLQNNVKTDKNLIDLLINKNNLTSKLTKREIECIACLQQGLRYKEIGKQLNISHRTVEKHINSTRAKLNCRNQLELITKILQ